MASDSVAGFAGFGDLAGRILDLKGSRSIVALAGPPGGGKSTLSERLADALNAARPGTAAVVQADGFHYDDSILDARGLRSRKGSPPTFDVGGLRCLLDRLRKNEEDEIAAPVFDRSLELSRGSARLVPRSAPVVIVEGLYLLLKAEPWAGLLKAFDLTIMVTEDRAVLEDRLINRWLSFGYDHETASRKVLHNDVPNMELVLFGSAPADVVIRALRGNTASR